jgi:hypothetical protein
MLLGRHLEAAARRSGLPCSMSKWPCGAGLQGSNSAILRYLCALTMSNCSLSILHFITTYWIPLLHNITHGTSLTWHDLTAPYVYSRLS